MASAPRESIKNHARASNQYYGAIDSGSRIWSHQGNHAKELKHEYRRPNTDDLGLERAGIDTDERGKGAFTHTSYNDF
jgi:hypothetical protein